MGQNREQVLEHCNPAMELGFSLAEYQEPPAGNRRQHGRLQKSTCCG